MAFIATPDETASDEVAALYDADRAAQGYVANYTRAFAHRPDVYAAWRALVGTLSGSMDPRRYELATLSAALRLRSSYCSLAHGTRLAAAGVAPETVRTLALRGTPLELSELDRAIATFADMVAADATSVTSADVDRLRELGLSDPEIVDVALVAALRCFFAKTLDALGVEPDAAYGDVEPGLRDALTVGRPIADG
jgi:uncharacterized peroxidase-related enzyme